MRDINALITAIKNAPVAEISSADLTTVSDWEGFTKILMAYLNCPEHAPIDEQWLEEFRNNTAIVTFSPGDDGIHMDVPDAPARFPELDASTGATVPYAAFSHLELFCIDRFLNKSYS